MACRPTSTAPAAPAGSPTSPRPSDGRFLITLTGVCRFDVASELEVDTPYRQVVADFARWRQDLQPSPPPGELKASLAKVLRAYFDRHGIEADWSAIESAPLAGLVTSLCMICPFEPEEKQALLEAGDSGRQARLLDRADGDGGAGRARRLQRPPLSGPAWTRSRR